MRVSIALAILVLACALGAMVWLRPRTVEVPASSVVADLGEAAPSDRGAALPEGILEPVPASPVMEARGTNVRSFLRDYWGPRWEKLEPVLAGAGLDLEQSIVILPWEEAAPLFHEFERTDVDRQASADMLLKWPSELSTKEGQAALRLAVDIPSRIALSESDLVAIEVEAASYNDSLRALAAEYNSRLDSYMKNAWRTGAYVKAPFTTMGLDTGGGFYGSATSAGGWAVSVTLREEDCPDLLTLRDEAHGIRAQRNQVVLKYLKDRGY